MRPKQGQTATTRWLAKEPSCKLLREHTAALPENQFVQVPTERNTTFVGTERTLRVKTTGFLRISVDDLSSRTDNVRRIHEAYRASGQHHQFIRGDRPFELKSGGNKMNVVFLKCRRFGAVCQAFVSYFIQVLPKILPDYWYTLDCSPVFLG